MKRKFLNIISFFLALFIFVGSFVFCFPSRVSAAGNSSTVLSFSGASSISSSDLSSLYSNSSFVPGCLFVRYTGFSTYSGICNLDDFYHESSGGWNYYCNYNPSGVRLSSYHEFSSSSTSDINFSSISNNVSEAMIFGFSSSDFIICYTDSSFLASNSLSSLCQSSVPDNNDYWHQLPPKRPTLQYAVVYPLNSSFVSDYLTGFVTGFDYSTDAFVQWLIDTGKYQDLPAYIGTSKLASFVDFYKSWGSSNKLFVVKILDWFAHFNIGAQSLENRNILKSTIDRLYQEYCNSSYVTFKSNSANNVHHRQNINTKTDDSDLTLVTDDSNDDTITSILRDILRGVIAIPTSIYNNSQAIISKLDSLNWTVNIANDGGFSSGSDLTPVLNKMDDIIDKLDADTVSVEIDQTTKDYTDDFFDDWNLEFSSALNNKFPVASQLRNFFTGFFERCGIDADSDGAVYQYYNPGVLTASTVSRSAGTSSEADIVSDFLSKFDNSDPTFLDDASFQGVPDLSVSVGGHSVSIIDFRVYAKYRDKIHFIISFVIWTLYLLHLYKALPSIIGQVADVAVKTSDL